MAGPSSRRLQQFPGEPDVTDLCPAALIAGSVLMRADRRSGDTPGPRSDHAPQRALAGFSAQVAAHISRPRRVGEGANASRREAVAVGAGAAFRASRSRPDCTPRFESPGPATVTWHRAIAGTPIARVSAVPGPGERTRFTSAWAGAAAGFAPSAGRRNLRAVSQVRSPISAAARISSVLLAFATRPSRRSVAGQIVLVVIARHACVPVLPR